MVPACSWHPQTLAEWMNTSALFSSVWVRACPLPVLSSPVPMVCFELSFLSTLWPFAFLKQTQMLPTTWFWSSLSSKILRPRCLLAWTYKGHKTWIT